MAGMGGEAIVLKEFYWMTQKMLESAEARAASRNGRTGWGSKSKISVNRHCIKERMTDGDRD